MKDWEIIADNLSEAGFSWGCSSEIDSTGRVIFTADAYARDGRRFTVLSDEKLTAFLELEAATRELASGATRHQLPAVSHSAPHAHSAIALRHAKGRQ
jgi:hypothetical protein